MNANATTTITALSTARRPLAAAAKRSFDLTLALFALALLSPLMLFVAAAIRIRMGSPVLFRQERPGLNGVPFQMLKFRTMRQAVDATGKPLPDAERLTALGRFLRATSIDELPELINVLKGEMSLVGPRPLLMRYLERYTIEQMRRHAVKPGITGWAQVHGRNEVDWDKRLEADVWYVDHGSFWLDIAILFRTVWIVLAMRGIRQKGQATMSEFLGSARGASEDAGEGVTGTENRVGE